MNKNNFFKWIFSWIKGTDGIMLAGTFLTLLWFDIDWCMSTTFTAMSNPQLYLVTFTVTLLLLAPWMLTRSRTVGILIILILGLISEANLVYCRTYLTAISPHDYLLAGNMIDFTDSIWPNLRWWDLGFVIILVGVILSSLLHKYSKKRKALKPYLALTGTFVLISAVYILCLGGFYKAYSESLHGAHKYSCGVPTYTIAGHIAFKLMEEHRLNNPNPEELKAVDNWIRKHREKYTPNICEETRKNLVLLICESLESWPIGLEIEGKEITPFLNSLVNDSNSFYAPNVMTQVCVGNSIDGQLIYTTGLLPTTNMVYSMNYPDREYPSLNKVLKKDRNSKSILMTVDKPLIWNMLAVTKAFGYDTILHNGNWKQDEIMRRNITDGSFFRQTVAELKKGELWPEGSPAMLTFVTYSGHSPFILNKELRDPNFDVSTSGLPKLLEDYITTAHYVDAQLKTIIDYLKSRSDSHETMIVILGDHNRKDQISPVKLSGKLVGNGMHTPLIIVNSPVSGQYDGVLGQVDVFPTLLDMLGVKSDEWRGVGVSLLDSTRLDIAFSTIPPAMEGNPESHSDEEIEHIKEAQSISETIIIHDLYRKK